MISMYKNIDYDCQNIDCLKWGYSTCRNPHLKLCAKMGH